MKPLKGWVWNSRVRNSRPAFQCWREDCILKTAPFGKEIVTKHIGWEWGFQTEYKEKVPIHELLLFWMISFLFHFRTWNPRLQKACCMLYPSTGDLHCLHYQLQRICNLERATQHLIFWIKLLSEYLTIHTLSKIWVLFWFNLSISLRWIAFLDETMAIRLKWISSAEYLKKEKV